MSNPINALMTTMLALAGFLGHGGPPAGVGAGSRGMFNRGFSGSGRNRQGAWTPKKPRNQKPRRSNSR